MRKQRNQSNRKQLTEEGVKSMYLLRKCGGTTKIISKTTNYGASTIQSTFRVGNYLKDKDYVSVLREFSCKQTSKLTDKVFDKVRWICNEVGAEIPTVEELENAFKILHSENETVNKLVSEGEEAEEIANLLQGPPFGFGVCMNFDDSGDALRLIRNHLAHIISYIDFQLTK